MKPFIMSLVVLSASVLAGQAMASEDCAIPAGGSVQPKETLQQKLEADGWQVRQIKLEDNCYEVYAIKADGTRMESEFNAATLALQNDESDDDGSDESEG